MILQACLILSFLVYIWFYKSILQQRITLISHFKTNSEIENFFLNFKKLVFDFFNHLLYLGAFPCTSPRKHKGLYITYIYEVFFFTNNFLILRKRLS